MSETSVVTQEKPITREEAFIESMNRMQMVVAQMKEIPQLPSEKPKDVHALLKVEFPEAGGILTYMEGYDHPYRGFPFYEFVDRIDYMKKIVRAFLSGLYHGLKGKKWLLFTLIPAFWLSKIVLHSGIYVFYRMIERFRIKRQYFSQPIRELHRAFSVNMDKEDEKMHELRLRLRDLICMVLEFDNAYRYRFQDIIMELNKESLKKDTNKELIRLLDVMKERENTQDISDTWTLAKLFIKHYFKIDKKFAGLIRDTLNELNLEEVRLSIEDQFYCKPRKDYKFGFQLCQPLNFSSIKDSPLNGKSLLQAEQGHIQSGHPQLAQE